MPIYSEVTFLVPFVNKPAFLKRALLSIIEQTDPYWRCIVVDDCSEDEVEQIVAQLNDSRFEYVRNSRRLGIPSNWNFALSLVSTRYAVVLHADDELERNYVASMVTLMNEHADASIGYCRVRVIDEHENSARSLVDFGKTLIRPLSIGRSILLTEGESGMRTLLRGDWIYCPTICFRRNSLPQNIFDNRWKFVPDYEFLLRLLLDGRQIVGTSRRLYRYRRHPYSQTSILTKNLHRFFEEFQLMSDIAEMCSEHGWHSCYRIARAKHTMRLHAAIHGIRLVLSGSSSNGKMLLIASWRGRFEPSDVPSES